MNPVLWHYFETADGQGFEALMRRWRDARPGLGLLALVSERDAAAVALLQAAANRCVLPLAGAIVPGLITETGFSRKGVLLLALDAGIAQTIVRLPRQDSRADEAAMAELAAFVERHRGEEGSDTLLLFIDAMIPDIGSLLDRLYLRLGNQVRYAGSNVGSESFQPTPCLFSNTAFVDGAILALLLPQHPGAILAHHYSSAATLGVASGTARNRVASIDGCPAFERYRELAAGSLGVELDRENFYRYAVHFPLAQQMAEGEPLVRIPVAVDEDGSLYCVGELRESAMLSIVRAPAPGRPETAQDVGAQLGALNPPAVAAFYCAGRLLQQGEAAAAEELAHLRCALPAVPVFGALSLGEIASYRGQGYPRFHNATIAALPWF